MPKSPAATAATAAGQSSTVQNAGVSTVDSVCRAMNDGGDQELVITTTCAMCLLRNQNNIGLSLSLSLVGRTLECKRKTVIAFREGKTVITRGF